LDWTRSTANAAGVDDMGLIARERLAPEGGDITAIADVSSSSDET